MPLAEQLLARAAEQGLVLGPTQLAALTEVAGLTDRVGVGVYLHGPAGLWKTWLLDGVVACSSWRIVRAGQYP